MVNITDLNQESVKYKNKFQLIFLTLLAFVITIITLLYINNQIKNQLKYTTQSFSYLINEQDIKTLTGTKNDLTNPTYITLKNKFINIQKTNPSFRFVYLMAKYQDQIIFLMDSEDPASEDYSHPGQIYVEASNVIHNIFNTNKVEVEVAKDRWGFWISGFAPILDENNKTIAVIGLDKDAIEHYFLVLFISGLLPILTFLIIGILLINNTKTKIIQLQACKEKQDLISILSNNISTPLTSIKWANENIITEFEQTTKQQMFPQIVQINTLTNTLIKQISALITLNDLQSNKYFSFEPIYINKALKTIKNQYTKTYQLQNFNIIFEENDKNIEKVIVNANKELLSNALDNLILLIISNTKTNQPIKIQTIVDTTTIKIVASFVANQNQEEMFKSQANKTYEELLFDKDINFNNLYIYLLKKIIVLHKGTFTMVQQPNKAFINITLPILSQ